jgi:uncharacterized protein (TIGR00106 family)
MYLLMATKVQPIVHAEISVIPITSYSDASSELESPGMSKQIAVAFDAIRKVKNVNVILTPMGTQLETSDFKAILNAIGAAHHSLRSEKNIKRIISTIRIDERLDKSITLHDKVQSVMDKLHEAQI